MDTTPKVITVHHVDRTIEVRELTEDEKAQLENAKPSQLDAIFANLESTPPQ